MLGGYQKIFIAFRNTLVFGDDGEVSRRPLMFFFARLQHKFLRADMIIDCSLGLMLSRMTGGNIINIRMIGIFQSSAYSFQSHDDTPIIFLFLNIFDGMINFLNNFLDNICHVISRYTKGISLKVELGLCSIFLWLDG